MFPRAVSAAHASPSMTPEEEPAALAVDLDYMAHSSAMTVTVIEPAREIREGRAATDRWTIKYPSLPAIIHGGEDDAG